jgi:hypothetical protein
MTLSLKLRLKRELTSRSMASSAESLDTNRFHGGEESSGRTKAVNVAQGVPRRLTRSLARKLREGSPRSVEVWEISPVLGSTTRQVKPEEVARSDTSSLSPPCLTASIQPAVSQEQLEESSAGPLPSRDTAAPLPSSEPTFLGRACAVCGTSAVGVITRDQSRKSLCDSCLVAFTEQETAEQVRFPDLQITCSRSANKMLTIYFATDR